MEPCAGAVVRLHILPWKSRRQGRLALDHPRLVKGALPGARHPHGGHQGPRVEQRPLVSPPPASPPLAAISSTRSYSLSAVRVAGFRGAPGGSSYETPPPLRPPSPPSGTRDLPRPHAPALPAPLHSPSFPLITRPPPPPTSQLLGPCPAGWQRHRGLCGPLQHRPCRLPAPLPHRRRRKGRCRDHRCSLYPLTRHHARGRDSPRKGSQPVERRGPSGWMRGAQGRGLPQLDARLGKRHGLCPSLLPPSSHHQPARRISPACFPLRSPSMAAQSTRGSLTLRAFDLEQSPLYVIQSTHDPVHMDFSHAIGACPGGMMATGGCASTGAKTDEWHEAVVESVKHVRCGLTTCCLQSRLFLVIPTRPRMSGVVLLLSTGV